MFYSRVHHPLAEPTNASTEILQSFCDVMLRPKTPMALWLEMKHDSTKQTEPLRSPVLQGIMSDSQGQIKVETIKTKTKETLILHKTSRKQTTTKPKTTTRLGYSCSFCSNLHLPCVEDLEIARPRHGKDLLLSFTRRDSRGERRFVFRFESCGDLLFIVI